ncbi:MAG TPA: hypothetical protein VGX23_24150 [Actinocrinis sp.]|nr:hypothetical protein [Actinocrinis sp.]
MSRTGSPARTAWPELIARFDLEPAGYARPDRLASACGLPVAIVDRLRGNERFAGRLSGRLVSHFELPPCRGAPIGELDLALALRPPQDIVDLPKVFGGLWHAASIRLVIAREDRQALIDAIGPRLYGFLLGRPPLGPSHKADRADLLIGGIAGDGRAILGHWLQTLPPAFARRLGLMLPDERARELGAAATPRRELGAAATPSVLAALVGAAAEWYAGLPDA